MSAALSISDGVGARFCAFLRGKYAPLKHANKLLARDARVTPRTAENWLDLECTPRFEQAVMLMAADPEIEAAVLDLVRGLRAERKDI